MSGISSGGWHARPRCHRTQRTAREPGWLGTDSQKVLTKRSPFDSVHPGFPKPGVPNHVPLLFSPKDLLTVGGYMARNTF